MRYYILALALLLLFPGSARPAWEAAILPRGFSHESSLQKAVDRAKVTGRAVIVYYTRTQCPPCDALQARLRKDSIGEPFRSGYVFTAVWGNSMSNTEREHYRIRFGVQGAPTWLVFNSLGDYICTARGGFGSDEAGLKLNDNVQELLKSGASAPSEPVECTAPPQ